MKFSEIFALPMTPAQSWTLVLLLMTGCAFLTYMIYYFDHVIPLAIGNCKEVGPKGILWAMVGDQAVTVNRERLVDISSKKKDGFYHVLSTDGEESYRYLLLPVSTDEGNPQYDEIAEIVGDNEELRESLLPAGRVRGIIRLDDHNTDSTIYIMVAYLKHDNLTDAEAAVERYFDENFEEEIHNTRMASL